MAYSERYYYEYKDFGFSDTFRIELHQDGYSGSASSIPFAERQVDFIFDRGKEPYDLVRRIIRGTEVEFKFAVQPASDLNIFDEIATSEYKEWKLIRKKNGTKIFEGYVKQEHTDRPMLHLNVPYTMTLVGTCGLGDLKGILFRNSSGDQYDDRVNGLTVIKRCLEAGSLPQLDFRIQLNTYETSLMTSTEQALEEVTFDCRRFYTNENGRIKPWKCDEVLRHVLKIFHCYICQIDGYWWIINPREIDSYYHEYDYATLSGASGGRIANDLEVAVDSYNTYEGDRGRKSWVRPIKRMEVTFENKNLGDDESDNGDFQTGDTTGWTNDNWDTWTVDANGTDYFLITTHNSTSDAERSIHADSFNIASYEPGDKLKVDYKVRLESLLFSGSEPPNGQGRPQVYVGVQKDGAGSIFYGTKRTILTADGWLSLTDYFDLTGTGSYTVYFYVDPDVELTFMRYYWNDISFNQQRQADEVTFDRVFVFTNTAEAFDELEETVKFGDSIQTSDVGALKIGTELTSAWAREGTSEALPLLTIYGLQLLSDYQQFNTAWQIKLHDPNDVIRPSSILTLQLDSDSVTGEIIKYERDQRERVVTVTVRELPLTDAGYTSEEILLTTVDGEKSGSSEVSINVPSYWQQGDAGIYSINKVGIGRVTAGTYGLEVDASAGIYAADGDDAVLALYSGSDHWDIYHDGTSNDLYFDYNGVTKALISQGALEADSLTRKAYVDANLGGQALDSSVTSPTSGHDGYALVWDETSGEYILADVTAGGGGVTNWIDLSDTDPTGYAGSAGYVVRVNATPDGLEFYDMTTYVDGHLGGQDLHSSITSPSNDGYAVTWNATGSYFELTNVAGVSTWLGLSDVNDANYTGKGGYFVRVDSDPDGLELYDLLGSNVTVTGDWTFAGTALTVARTSAAVTMNLDADDTFSAYLYYYSGTDYWRWSHHGSSNKHELYYNTNIVAEFQTAGTFVTHGNISSSPDSSDGYLTTAVASGYNAYIRLQIGTDSWYLRHQNSTDQLQFLYNATPRMYITADGEFHLSSDTLFIEQPLANDDTLTQILARDSITGEIKYRSSSSLGEGGTAYTDEQAQDAVVSMLQVTDTIDWAYDDPGAALSAYVIYQMSITKDFDGLKLVNDEDAPGISEYYGTDVTGVKGWYALPAAGSSDYWPLSGGAGLNGNVAIDQGDGYSITFNNAGGFYLYDTLANGVIFESDDISLINTAASLELSIGFSTLDINFGVKSWSFGSAGSVSMSIPSNDDTATTILALNGSNQLVYRAASSLGGGSGTSGWPLSGTATLEGGVTVDGNNVGWVTFQNFAGSFEVVDTNGNGVIFQSDAFWFETLAEDLGLTMDANSIDISMGLPAAQIMRFNSTGTIEIVYDLPNDDNLSHILVRDEVSGQIKYRDVSSFTGVTAAGDATELQMNNGSGVFAGSNIFRTSNNVLTLGDVAIAGNQTIAVESSTADANLILDPQGSGIIDMRGWLRLVTTIGTLIDAASYERHLVYLDDGHLWFSDGTYWHTVDNFFNAGSDFGAVSAVTISCREARNVDKYIASSATACTVSLGELSIKSKILLIYKKTTASDCTLTLDSDTGYFYMFCNPEAGGKSSAPDYTLSGADGSYWQFVLTATPDVVSGYTRVLVEYAGPYG